jgi:hypothetical protein
MRFLFLFIPFFIYAANLEYTLFKKEGEIKGNTLLVIGGIHGNEPGGYFAGAFLEKYYNIKKGSLWLTPNLNFDSIIMNERGIYGDMNRKFSSIKEHDEDYEIVTKIKKVILDEKVDLILNLHDGYGFYRHKYENAIFNPNAWGQATIIDQEKIHGLEKFGDLDKIANQVQNAMNTDELFKEHHLFGVKNTETKFKDEQQQLSLTFFAVTHNKPAFAIETSKNITDLTQKVIYQLKSIEEFMHIMDIEFERKFDISNYEDVKAKVYDFETVTINDNIKIPLTDISKTLRFVPMKKEGNKIEFSHVLGAYKIYGGVYRFYIGNKHICSIHPQYFEIKEATKPIKIEVDGNIQDVKLGTILDIKNSFEILKNGYRVNIIGYSKSGIDSEDGILINKDDILNRYSIDKENKKYRAEFYKDGKFYGMIVLNFEEK